MASIQGHVRTSAGVAIADVSVSVAEAPGRVPDIAAVSNAAGEFALDDLPPGNYLLSALGPSREVGTARVRVSEDRVANVEILVRRP